MYKINYDNNIVGNNIVGNSQISILLVSLIESINVDSNLTNDTTSNTFGLKKITSSSRKHTYKKSGNEVYYLLHNNSNDILNCRIYIESNLFMCTLIQRTNMKQFNTIF